MEVPTLEQHEELRRELAEALLRIARLEAQMPEWMREHEAQLLTGLSQSTLSRERRKPDTLIVWKSQGGVRYLRSSVEAFNEARCIRRKPLAAIR
jgi:hypothetical protein